MILGDCLVAYELIEKLLEVFENNSIDGNFFLQNTPDEDLPKGVKSRIEKIYNELTQLQEDLFATDIKEVQEN